MRLFREEIQSGERLVQHLRLGIVVQNNKDVFIPFRRRRPQQTLQVQDQAVAVRVLEFERAQRLTLAVAEGQFRAAPRDLEAFYVAEVDSEVLRAARAVRRHAFALGAGPAFHDVHHVPFLVLAEADLGLFGKSDRYRYLCVRIGDDIVGFPLDAALLVRVEIFGDEERPRCV